MVYEVVRYFEVEVDEGGASRSIAMRDAIARVERGDVPETPLTVRHIAFPAESRIRVDDPREILRALLQATPERRIEAAQRAGVFNPLDPSDQAEWLSAVLRRAIADGKLASLASALADAGKAPKPLPG